MEKKTRPKKAKAAKRKYTRRAAPHPLPTLSRQRERELGSKPSLPLRDSAGERGESLFAINEDGDLGITKGESRIAMNRTDVQRLQTFLKTVAPLWS